MIFQLSLSFCEDCFKATGLPGTCYVVAGKKTLEVKDENIIPEIQERISKFITSSNLEHHHTNINDGQAQLEASNTWASLNAQLQSLPISEAEDDAYSILRKRLTLAVQEARQKVKDLGGLI